MIITVTLKNKSDSLNDIKSESSNDSNSDRQLQDLGYDAILPSALFYQEMPYEYQAQYLLFNINSIFITYINT